MESGRNRRGFRITGRRADVDRDVSDEIAFHLAMRERELMAAGLGEEEARRVARESFGDVEAVRAECERIGAGVATRRRVGWWVASVLQDLRSGVRALARSPWFAAVAVATLALGIGGNVAVFGLIEAALLRAPAVRDPSGLATVWTTCRRGDPRCASSYPDFLDYRSRSTRFRDMAAYHPVALTMTAQDGAELVGAEAVTESYFEVLGLRARVGRLLQPGDGGAGGDPAVAVLSHGFWRSRFGGDAGVVGRAIGLNGVPYVVVGVAPPGFTGLVLGQVPDVWLPLDGLPRLFPAAYDRARFEERGSRWILGLIARLSEDATLEGARAEMLRISDQLFAEDSVARGPRRVTVDPLVRRVMAGNDAVASLLAVLQVAVALTLLLACANLANLLLARGTSRRGEMAVRVALGVGRGRLVRQLLMESLVLAVLGGMAGVALAALALRLIGGFELPFGFTPGSMGAGVNAAVVAFALVVSVGTGLVFGLLPALTASRADVAGVLREVRGGETRRRAKLRSSLVALQLGLGVVLLVGAGLFIRTLQNRLSVDLGFPVDGLALVSLDPSMSGHGPERADALIAEFVRRAADQPGVRAAGAGRRVPVERGGMGTFALVDGYVPAPDEEMRVEFGAVAPGYLRALGLPLVAGREFTEAEVAAGRRVVVIDETMAARWWRGRDPIGSVVRVGGGEYEVVGVARRTAWGGPDVGGDPFVFLPVRSGSGGFEGPSTVIVRTDGDAAGLLPVLRDGLRRLDPGVAPTSIRTMRRELAAALAPQRAAAWLLGVFGALALAIAAVGIWAVVSYVVAQRRRDLSVRMALGASRADVVRMVARGMLAPVTLGLIGGLLAARLLGTLLDRLLYGVSITDAPTYAAAFLVLAGVAAVATLVPAARAGRARPMEVMRAE